MRFASRYYHHPIGQVVMGALPQGLRRARADRGDGPRGAYTRCTRCRLVHLPARAVAKRRVLEHLRANGACHPAVLRMLASSAPRALRDLIAQGWVAPETDAPLALVEPSRPLRGSRPRPDPRSANRSGSDRRHAGTVCSLAAAGHHRQRQDRGVPAVDRTRAASGADRRCCWCRRSISRRSSRPGWARAFLELRWSACTVACPRPSDCAAGVQPSPGRRKSWSARGSRCSRRCPGSA